MSVLVSDPKTLTKDKLKKELAKIDVALPSTDAKKEIYVELYRRHVLKESAEFSSDEDLSPKVRRKRPGSPKKSLSKKPSKMSAGGIDVASLTDEDLATMLREKGVDIGPIVASTRRVYQKKLEKLLKEAEAGEQITMVNTQTSTPDTVDIADLDVSDTENDGTFVDSPVQSVVLQEKVEVTTRRQTRSSPPRPSRKTVDTPDRLPKDEHLVRRTTRSKARTEEKGDAEVSNSTVSTTTSTITTKTTSSKSPSSASATVEQKPQSKRGLSIWLQIGLFIIVALVIFFVIQNMEPAASDPVNKIEQDIP